MTHLLLLGAGFSRNWNGMLSRDIRGDLLGRVQDDGHLVRVLQRFPNFEDALNEIQAERDATPSGVTVARLERLEREIVATFQRMNEGFRARLTMNFANHVSCSVVAYLARFDAIFTLNQDLLLELLYCPQMELPGLPRFNGCELPGMIEQRSTAPLYNPMQSIWHPTGEYRLATNIQPIFKLHGSVNWRDEGDGRVMVMGGGKIATIQRTHMLRRYSTEFAGMLSRPSARLMVIGYGFLDRHINDAIYAGWQAGGLRLFVVHPKGLEVLRDSDPSNRGPLRLVNELEEVTSCGESLTPLSSTFSGDNPAELERLRAFFE